MDKWGIFHSGIAAIRDASVMAVHSYHVYRVGSAQSASASAPGMTVFIVTTTDIQLTYTVGLRG